MKIQHKTTGAVLLDVETLRGAKNPGVHDNGSGGLVYVSECVRCGVRRKRGSDYTGERPGNDWGPHYYRGGDRVHGYAAECRR
jgi:hypothetical protein